MGIYNSSVGAMTRKMNVHILRLDKTRQHLGDDCKLKGFLCALRAQSWEVYISIKYPVVLDIGCQQFGEYNSVGYIC